MAVQKPYGTEDVFATADEARRAEASVTDIPLNVFQDSLAQPEVQAMVRAAAQIRSDVETELPAFD